MSLASMTGFARAEGANDALSWTWELKSVNGRNLDVRARLPNGFDELDGALRVAAGKKLQRGHLSAGLQVTRAAAGQEVRLNEEVLAKLLEVARGQEGAPGTAPARLDGLLAMRGVVEIVEPRESGGAADDLNVAILQTFDDALDHLSQSRAAEGARIETVLRGLIDEIATLAESAAVRAAERSQGARERLMEQIGDLVGEAPALSEERLAQEVAVLLVRADVTEEIDRIAAHVAAARDLLGEGGAVGRRFDFLCQEFGREANTVCSKAGDVALSQIGIDLKVAIDRLREQVQNIE